MSFMVKTAPSHLKVRSDISHFMVVFGICIMFVSAQIVIPLHPVPITMQTLGVLFISLFFRPKEAMSSIIGYVTIGTIGLPVFSNFSSGLFTPKGGYLLGFILCVYLVSKLRSKMHSTFCRVLLCTLIGNASIYIIGLPWLACFVGIDKALSFGLVPFLLPGLFKSILIAFIVKIYSTLL